MNVNKFLSIWMLACTHLFLVADLACADEVETEPLALAVGGGFATVNFDTKMKIDQYDADLPIFIDLEGNLDLPSTNTIETLFIEYTPSPRHQFSASYFRTYRQSDIRLINFSLPDQVYLRAYIETQDRTQFINWHYKYSPFYNEYNKISAFAGIFLMDLDLRLDIAGTIEGETGGLVRRESEKVKAAAPLPMIGFQIESKLTNRWSISTMFSAMSGSYDGDTATISQTRINLTYNINRKWVVISGVTYFDASVKIFLKSESQKIEYGYKGLYIGTAYRF